MYVRGAISGMRLGTLKVGVTALKSVGKVQSTFTSVFNGSGVLRGI